MPSAPAHGRLFNNYLPIVCDCCHSFFAAKPRQMRKLGNLERRPPYASWTAPSHYNLVMGLLPHRSPKRAIAGFPLGYMTIAGGNRNVFEAPFVERNIG